MIAERAKGRQIEAGKEYGKSHAKDVQNFGQANNNKHTTKSNTEAAKTVGNTNAEYVRQAEKIQEAAPEIAEQVTLRFPRFFGYLYHKVAPRFPQGLQQDYTKVSPMLHVESNNSKQPRKKPP